MGLKLFIMAWIVALLGPATAYPQYDLGSADMMAYSLV